MTAAEETVRLAYEAVRRGDVVGLLNACAADVEWRLCGPTACARAGREGVAEWLLEVEPHLPDVRFTPSRILEAGSEVVVVGFAEERDRATGRWAGRERVHLWRLAAGKVARVVEYDATV